MKRIMIEFSDNTDRTFKEEKGEQLLSRVEGGALIITIIGAGSLDQTHIYPLDTINRVLIAADKKKEDHE